MVSSVGKDEVGATGMEPTSLGDTIRVSEVVESDSNYESSWLVY